MAQIHSSSIVSPSAEIAEDVVIGPFCHVGPNVKIGPGCELVANVYVTGHTSVGSGNRFFPNTVIGSEPEDHKFAGGESYLRIGDDNVFRENFVANVATKPGNATVIGNRCFFMARTHVAHECVIGDEVIFVGNSGVAGHVTVQDNCLISGLSGAHQFCRLGRLSLLSGGSLISMDLPPFVIGEGRNGAIKSLNLVGLRRKGFSRETIRALNEMFKIFFRGGLKVSEAIARIRGEVELIPEVEEFIAFVESSERGVLHGRDTGRRL